MSRQWPAFVTSDLSDSEADSAEMLRRWQNYDRQMKALIAAGGVHQDADGWWVDDATGDLIGPDPEIERPLSAGDIQRARPLKEASPELYESIRRSRGRPPAAAPKRQISIRLSPDVIEAFKATGPGWQSRMDEALRKAAGL